MKKIIIAIALLSFTAGILVPVSFSSFGSSHWIKVEAKKKKAKKKKKKKKKSKKKNSNSNTNLNSNTNNSSQNFTCSGKAVCSQMTSCDEAKFYLNTCGVISLDGDKDGIPCENICE